MNRHQLFWRARGVLAVRTDEIDWHVYGAGKVTADGKQVVPDPGVAFYEFTGAMMITNPSPPADAPLPDTPDAGEPVDLGTGLFVMDKTDLFLPDVIPIALTRTYRQNDPATVYIFGDIAPLQAIRDRHGNTISETDSQFQTADKSSSAAARRDSTRLAH